MLPLFQFNLSKPIDYPGIFKPHVCQKLRKEDQWKMVEPTFQRLAQLRASFNWKELKSNDHFLSPQMRTIQDNIENYLKYCFFLSTKFKFGQNDGVQHFVSDWQMAWSQQGNKSQHIFFEICCFLFNYSILNFNQAVLLLAKKHDAPAFKDALTKIRYAKWAMKELGRFTPEINKIMKMPLEFCPQAVSFMTALFEGLCYMATLRLLEEQLASLEREIGKWFFICRQICKENSTLRKQVKAYLPDIMFNYYWHTYNALSRMASEFGKKHELEITKGHIGVQLAYLRELKSLVKTMDKEEFMSKQGKAQIKEAWKPVEPLMNEIQDKINNIYKCEVPKSENLTYIEEWDKKVPDLEPKNIRVPPEDAQYFQDFMSEELERIKSSVELYVKNKQTHIQKSFNDIGDSLAEAYRDHNIKFYLNAEHLKNNSVDEDFKVKMSVIREQNGGVQGYNKLNSDLSQFRKNIEDMFRQTDYIFEKEKQNDQTLYQKNIGKGTYAPFE
jgi:hypothetical protein